MLSSSSSCEAADVAGLPITSTNNGEADQARRQLCTNSSWLGNTGDSNGIVDLGKCRYEYPFNYFILSTGYVPKDADTLKKRWGYQKKRQEAGTAHIDEVSFNSAVMIQEMSELRQSLRVYAHLKYMEYIQPLLKEHGFVRPTDSQSCVTMDDVCRMIRDAPGLSYDKSDQLFEIFHYKVSAWTSNVVDAWAETNEIVIKMPKRVASLQRQPNNDFYRGSFGPIVNSARMESVKKKL